MFDQAEALLTPVVKPAPSKPVVQPVLPAQLTQPIQSTQPTQLTQPIQSTQPTQPTQPIQPTQPTQPEKTALVKESETDKCVQVQINGVRYRIRARRNLATWNVVLHIEAREGEVQSFMYASEADVLFDVEYRGHVFKTPVNPRGTMKDLKVNAVTVGLAGAGDA